jgi:hypothetical protein
MNTSDRTLPLAKGELEGVLVRGPGRLPTPLNPPSERGEARNVRGSLLGESNIPNTPFIPLQRFTFL